MDPATLSILVTVASVVGHFIATRFLPPASSTPPALPTSVGHGEVIRFLEQLVANAVAKTQPASQPTDLLSELEKLIAAAVAKAQTPK